MELTPWSPWTTSANASTTTPRWTTSMTSGCDEPFQFSMIESVVAGSAASLCSFLGTSLNVLTVVALLNYPNTRNHVTTPFIVSLACSDALFSALTLPILAIKFFARDWVLGEWWCQVFPVLFYANSAITLLSLMSVTLNRWALIYFGATSESRLFTRTKSKFILALCWLFPPTLLLPSLFGIYGYHGLDCSSRSCTILDDHNGHSSKAFLLLAGGFVPFVILVVANFMILMKVKSTRRRVESHLNALVVRGATAAGGGGGGGCGAPKGLRERERKLALMMIIIFMAFLFSYVPGALIKVVDSGLVHPALHVVSYVVNWTNVVLNPIIYVATQVRYRRAFVILFSRTRDIGRGETSRGDDRRQSVPMANRGSKLRASNSDS